MRLRQSRRPWEGEPATIRAFFLAPFVQELAGSGIDVDRFLLKYGLSASQRQRPYERVSLRQYVALTEDIAERLQRPFLGLELAQNFTLADLGPFYALFALAEDLRSALGRFARFQSSWQTHTSLEVLRGKDTTIFRYCIEDASIRPRRQDAEYAIASICKVVRQLITDRWRPVEVEFEHNIRRRQARLSRFFRCAVAGNGASNLVVITNADLQRPVRWRMGAHEATLLPVLERHLLDLVGTHEARGENCKEHTSLLVARRLGRAPVDIASVATEMNLSPRTLRRRLADEGVSYRSLLKDQRRAKLESILRDGGAPLSVLADRLSYSDPCVVSRAFRAWTGTSLRHYSRTRRGEDS